MTSLLSLPKFIPEPPIVTLLDTVKSFCIVTLLSKFIVPLADETFISFTNDLIVLLDILKFPVSIFVASMNVILLRPIVKLEPVNSAFVISIDVVPLEASTKKLFPTLKSLPWS